MSSSIWLIIFLSLALISSLVYFSLRIRKIKKKYRLRINELRANGLSHEELRAEVKNLESQLALKEEKITFKNDFINSLKGEIQSANHKADHLVEAMFFKDEQISELKTVLESKNEDIHKLQEKSEFLGPFLGRLVF